MHGKWTAWPLQSVPDVQTCERARNSYRWPASGRLHVLTDANSPGQHAVVCSSRRGWPWSS